MKYLIPVLAFGTFLSTPGLFGANITRTVEKTFAVQPGGNLQVSTQGGDITIRTADSDGVHVLVKQVIRASTEKKADDLLSKLALRLEQSGNDVTAEAKYEKRSPKRWFSFGNWPPVTVSFVITVPRNFNVGLSTSGGDIAVASVNGNVRARTSGGDLQFERIDGNLDASTSGGDIMIREGTAHAKVRTSGGDIEVERAGGPIEASTSGGNITLRSVAHLISANTSGGDVRAVITEALKEDTVLGTSGGDVDVQVVKNAGFYLDASTSGGAVSATGFTIALDGGGINKQRLAGAVNGGGPRLKLRTSGGDVSVRSN